MIDHPPGAETQWDWLELPDPPAGWAWDKTAYVLIGTLPHSSRWRGWLTECTDQPHLVEGLDAVARRLGGLTRRWRFDRMSTVAQPQSGRLQVSFGPIARHYSVGIDLCPAYHPWRKGGVEKAAGVIAQRWWRTLDDEVTQDQAQTALDRLCVRLDGRKRVCDGITTTVGALADAEGLRPAPAQYPAVLQVARTVSNQARISFRGNIYSVPPGHTGRRLLVRHRLGELTLEVVTDTGVVLARHRRAPDGAGAVVLADEHVAALAKVVLANFADRPPCRRKHRRPPSVEALAEAGRIRQHNPPLAGEQVVADFARYAAAARPMRARQHGVRPDEHHRQRNRHLPAAAQSPGRSSALRGGRGASRDARRRPRPGPVHGGRTRTAAGRGSRNHPGAAVGLPAAVCLPAHRIASG